MPVRAPIPRVGFGPPGDADVLFVRRRREERRPDGGEGREHEDIMLRRVPRATAQRFRAAAGGRAMTHAQYLAALVQLHDAMRQRADGGDAALAEQLEALGLSSVTV